MTKAQLARALQVTIATVHAWLTCGCPHSRGDRGTYQLDLAAVRAWREAGIVRAAGDRDRRQAAHDNEETL